MADFPLIFTGKDVSYEPRTTGELERASQRFDERFLEGERYKAAERQKGEKFFYDALDVDPVEMMSDQLTRMQEAGINDFNDKWTAVYAKQGGTLTKAQQSEMFRDRKAMEAKQSKWLASQNRYEQDYEMYKRDAVKSNPMFDKDAFTRATEAYNRTGNYEGGLQFSPINPNAYFTKAGRTWSGSKDVRDVTRNVPGGTETYKVIIPGTAEEARADIKSSILNDNTGRLLMGVVQDFMAEDDEVKAKYLIEGEVDTPEEEQAIIRYAQEKYSPLLRKVDQTTKEKEKQAGDRVVNGQGTSSTGKVYFKTSDNVKGKFTGSGPGIEFNDARAIDIQTDLLELPEGMDIVNESLRVYPVLAANGKVEFRIDQRGITMMKKSKSSSTALSGGGSAALTKGKDEDGYYSWEVKLPAGTRAATSIDNVMGDLNAQYGNNIFQNTYNTLPAYEGEVDPDDKYLEK